MLSNRILSSDVKLCGIGAYLALFPSNKAVHKILRMLKKLEYRGYDSAGVAIINDEGLLEIRKDTGKIDEIIEKLKLFELEGYCGIGHTRWATHGKVSRENAHPHTDCKGEIAVVHNGIIENAIELRNELIRKGHIFRSETDTEVIPHLVEEHLKDSKDFFSAFEAAIKKLKGAYALAVISKREPNKIFFAISNWNRRA